MKLNMQEKKIIINLYYNNYNYTNFQLRKPNKEINLLFKF